jgi:hypothetical protein
VHRQLAGGGWITRQLVNGSLIVVNGLSAREHSRGAPAPNNRPSGARQESNIAIPGTSFASVPIDLHLICHTALEHNRPGAGRGSLADTKREQRDDSAAAQRNLLRQITTAIHHITDQLDNKRTSVSEGCGVGKRTWAATSSLDIQRATICSRTLS